MKKNIKEQATTMTDRTLLVNANTFGCFPKWLADGQIMDYQGKKVWTGKNSKGETVVFFANFTAKNLKTGKAVSWKCDQLSQTVGTSLENTELTPDQNSYIDTMVAKEGVTKIKPSDYESEKGKWDVIDLNTKNPTLFPIPKKYFVYKQKGEISVTSPQQNNIISSLEKIGFIKDQPAANKSELYVKVNLQTIENGKYKDSFTQPFYMYQPIEKVNVTQLFQDIEKSFNEQKVDKKQCRETIDLLYTAYIKGYKMEDSKRISLKNYAKNCSRQNRVPLFSLSKLKKLQNIESKDDQFKYSLNPNIKESKDVDNQLSKTIKEHLVRINENKKKTLLTEREILTNRFKVILENRDIRTKKQREILSEEIFNEMMYLKSNGYDLSLLNEDNVFTDLFKWIYGKGSSAVFGTLKEYVAKYILKGLGVDTDSWIGGTIVKAFGNFPITEIGKITDCNFVTKWIAKSIAEESIDKVKNSIGMKGAFFDGLRNALVDTLEETSFISKLEGSLSSLICPIVGNYKGKMEKLSDELKQKALS